MSSIECCLCGIFTFKGHVKRTRLAIFHRNRVISILLQRPLEGSYGMEYMCEGRGAGVSTVGREGRGNRLKGMVTHVG